MRLLKSSLAMSLVAGLTTAVLLPSSPAHAATAEFRVTSQWPTGYAAQMIVRNDAAAPITSWRVEFDLPAGTTVSARWNAHLSRSGTRHVFTNASWNGTVRPGDAAHFGWIARGSAAPANCLVNGAPCDGTGPVERDVNPPTTPENPRTRTSSAGLTLLWDPATDDRGVVAYEVFEQDRLRTTTAETSHTMAMPPPIVTFFGIRAVDAAGNVSPFAFIGLGTPVDTQAPTAPTGLGITDHGDDHFKLGWTASTDNVMVAGYEVYLNNALISRVGGVSGYVPFHGVGTYSFAVRAFDQAGNYSPRVSITFVIDPPPPTIPPTPPPRR